MGILRKTKNLETILDIFRQSNEALSANLLFERLHERMNRSTVYRLLERLEDDGILHSFASMDNVKFYALRQDCISSGDVHSHPHFQCTTCNQVVCLEQEVVFPTLNRMRIEEAQIFLKGQCHSCLSQ